MNKILVLHPKGYTRDTFFPDNLKEQLNKLGEVYWNGNERAYTEEELTEVIKDIDICLTGWEVPKFTKTVLDSAKKLKFIGHIGGNIRFFLPIEVFDRNIVVTNAAEPMAKHVAEGTLTLMLALLKDVVGNNNSMKYDKAWPGNYMYTDTLYGKRVGLVGLGRIGRYLIKLLKPFDVQISVYDPYIPETVEDELGIKLTTLDDVLMNSDIISIHAASTEETYKMLDLEKLQLIPYGTYLINTARAAIFDESALIAELKRGRFRAALDVFHQEPLPADNDLRRLPNVILTPHMVGMVAETRHEMTQCVINDLKLFLKGEKPKFQITKHMYNIMA
ncbi:MAG: hydroxyacid dehydrogenase [Clostridiales bacterium]|nr:hydroxyacid dehydrogenase [Clostridiales bacterium]